MSRAWTLPAPHALLLRFALAALLSWGLSRQLLAQLYSERVSGVHGWGVLATEGLRADLITLGWAWAIPVLLLPLCLSAIGVRLWSLLSRLWLALLLALLVLLEVISIGFMAEYELRPNHLLLDYLGRPRELIPMLWGGFRALLLTGLVLTPATAWLGWRWLRTKRAAALDWRHMLLWPLLLALCVLMIRSSLGHRPANPAQFAYWEDSLVNQMVLNGTYTLGYALHALGHEPDVSRIYGTLSDPAMLRWLRQDSRFAHASDERPTWHRQSPSHRRDRPLNLVIVVEESLGAGFSQRLGGAALTPHLDRWADRGWWFESLYATGTRSARGLEAIVAGFPPSPAPSVLKLERAQHGFTTLASVLGDAGYHSEFIYGGESHFDNMRGFFLGNGFNAVIDQDDYRNPVFRGSWGVSDEDLFGMAHRRAGALHAQGQPFFCLVFSSSNHTPFEYPPGRIQPVDAEPHTVRNAVLYADHALGGFLEQASRSAYFADTLILVVADHDVRVYGDDVVPVARFHIPGLLLGADLPPRTIASLASQIDLAPTLLSVMGLDVEHPFPGRDLTRTLSEFGNLNPPPARALMQFNDTFARMQGNQLDVLLAGGHAKRYQVASGPAAELGSGSALNGPDRWALQAEAVLPSFLMDHDGYRKPRPALPPPPAVALSTSRRATGAHAP